MTQRRLEIRQLVDEGLGHASHVVGLGDGSALVVDPARFPEEERGMAEELAWSLRWTADTHSHADYISGSPELAAAGVTFVASRGADLEVPHRAITPGETIELADGVGLRAIATPGHTPDHLAYLLEVDGTPEALFSGGSLMVGALGRTDLLGEDQREPLARALFRALRAEVLTLPEDLPVYPTHGAGSFCSAPSGAARVTSVGAERATNPLLRIDDEDRFVEELLRGLGTFPSYFCELPERNRRGPRVYGSIPRLPRLDVATVQHHVENGAALVDARPIGAFAAGHVPGSLSIQHRPVFATWLGWLVDLDRPIVFVLDDRTDRVELVRQCLRVGHEQLLGALDGGIDAWIEAGLPTSAIPLVDASGVGGVLLDVRQASEWGAGHVPGAMHVELGALDATAVPSGPVTVMCGHGERAMTGASVLEAAGHRDLSVLIGGPNDWADARGGALEVG